MLPDADETVVQDARAKAAAAGVPSSEPMTLEELEAVQAKMAAKSQQGQFDMGQQFLNQKPAFTDAAFRDVATPTIDERQADNDNASDSHMQASGAGPMGEAQQGLPPDSPEPDGNSLAEEQGEQEEEVDMAAVKVGTAW